MPASVTSMIRSIGLLAVAGVVSDGSVAETSQSGRVADSPVAVVVQVSGQVQAERAGQVDLSPGRLDLLYPGDRWRTGGTGQLAVRFIDNSLVRFTPDTAMAVQREGMNLRLELLGGGVEMARFTTSTGPALLRITGGSRTESDTATSAGLAIRRDGEDALTAGPPEDPEQLQAIAALAPTGWLWLAGETGQDDPGPRVAPGEQNLVERYRERTPLPVPDLMVTEEIEQIVRQSAETRVIPTPPSPAPEGPAPTEPERPQPTPALSPEEQFQQELDAVVSELGDLLRRGQSRQALDLAESRRRDFEGEPEFDLLYGRAALSEGAYQRASFALERALINFPGQPAVRLTLVEAYLGLGNTTAAGRQLERLQQDDLTPAQQARWTALDDIRRQLVLRSQVQESRSVSAQGFYTTNLNQGLACSVCELSPGLEYSPDNDSRASPGAGTSIQGLYSRVMPQSQRLTHSLQAGVNAELTTIQRANTVGAILGFQRDWESGRRYGVQLLPGWTPDRVSVTGVATGGVDDVWETRDGTASVSLTGDNQGGGTLQLSAGLGDDWAVAANDAVFGRWQARVLANAGAASSQHYAAIEVSASPQYTPPGQWVFQGNAAYQLQLYLDNETFNDEQQRNHQLSGALNALRPLNASTQISLSLSWQQVISNQPLAEFGAVELAAGVQHQW